jgi:hypothetical protein
MTLTRSEISKRYDQSPKGRLWRKQWVEANKEHLAEYHSLWVKKNSEKAAKSVAKWRKENPEKFNAQMKRYREQNKEKFAAYRKFKRALKNGLLHRPANCEECGKKTKIDAHHHMGYDRPLDVLWLCRQCHVDKHPLRRNPATKLRIERGPTV